MKMVSTEEKNKRLLYLVFCKKIKERKALGICFFIIYFIDIFIGRGGFYERIFDEAYIYG